jgi:hypothetical protein
MISQLTEFQTAMISAVFAAPGRPASAIAKQLGRDRNQVRAQLLKLADAGHISAEEAAGNGGRTVVFFPVGGRCATGDFSPVEPRVGKGGKSRAAPNEPLEAQFKVVTEAPNPAPTRQTFGGGMVQQRSPAVHGYRPPKLPARGTALVTFDPMGAHLRAQAARIEELEQAEAEREDAARRAATFDKGRAAREIGFAGLGLLRSILTAAPAPGSRLAPARSPAVTAELMPDAEPVVPFWMRRKAEPEPQMKKSGQYWK